MIWAKDLWREVSDILPCSRLEKKDDRYFFTSLSTYLVTMRETFDKYTLRVTIEKDDKRIVFTLKDDSMGDFWYYFDKDIL